MNMRESETIKRWLSDNPLAHDNDRIVKLNRLWSLEHTTPLSRQTARNDLNESAYYHAQPCYCDKCSIN